MLLYICFCFLVSVMVIWWWLNKCCTQFVISADLSAVHSVYHIPKVLYWIEVCRLKRPLEFTELTVKLMKPTETILVCDMEHYPAEVAFRRWRTVAIEGRTWSATILRQTVTLRPWLRFSDRTGTCRGPCCWSSTTWRFNMFTLKLFCSPQL